MHKVVNFMKTENFLVSALFINYRPMHGHQIVQIKVMRVKECQRSSL